MIGKWPFRQKQIYKKPPFSARMQARLFHARKRRIGDDSEYIPPTAFLHDFTAPSVTASSYTVGCSSLEVGGEITLAVRDIPWSGSTQEIRALILGQADDGTVIYRETKANALENTFTATVTAGNIAHYCAFVRTIPA